MLEKIKNYRNFSHPWIAQLQDVRSIGLVMFAVIVLLVSWSGVKVIQSNYKLQQQISQLQQENDVQKLKNSNLALKNQYYNTPQYLELAARQNFGLAQPGEKELIVPKAVAMTYVSDVAKPAAEAPLIGQETKPFYQRNMQAWTDFFLHRQAGAD